MTIYILFVAQPCSKPTTYKALLQHQHRNKSSSAVSGQACFFSFTLGSDQKHTPHMIDTSCKCRRKERHIRHINSMVQGWLLILEQIFQGKKSDSNSQ